MSAVTSAGTCSAASAAWSEDQFGLRQVGDRGRLAQPLPLTGMKWKTRDDWLLVTLAQPGEESPAPKLTTPSKSPIGATWGSRDPTAGRLASGRGAARRRQSASCTRLCIEYRLQGACHC